LNVVCQYNPLVNQIENEYALLSPFVMTAVIAYCVMDCYSIHAALYSLFDSLFLFRTKKAVNISGCGMYCMLIVQCSTQLN